MMIQRSQGIYQLLLTVVPLYLITILCLSSTALGYKRKVDKTKCPHVRTYRPPLQLDEMKGEWFVVQYYASSEEALPYRCMRAHLEPSADSPHITMLLSYTFTDDPDSEVLVGNITWHIETPTHWTHAEETYEGVYNTYVVDADIKSGWSLLLHCAEKAQTPRYLSSLALSRKPFLDANVLAYLRDKLPRYDIDLAFMFPVEQKDCNPNANLRPPPPQVIQNEKKKNRRHPLKPKHH